MPYFDLSKLHLAKTNVLKAFESQLQWQQAWWSGTEDHLICNKIDIQNQEYQNTERTSW